MSRVKGNMAEDKAALFLSQNGYSIVERNFYTRFGEIDIIAANNGILHFVEVKSGDDYELAIQNITPQKLSRIIKTLQVYLKKNAFDGDYMIDAVIVTPNNIEIVENITL